MNKPLEVIFLSLYLSFSEMHQISILSKLEWKNYVPVYLLVIYEYVVCGSLVKQYYECRYILNISTFVQVYLQFILPVPALYLVNIILTINTIVYK